MQVVRQSVGMLATNTYATIYTVPAGKHLIVSWFYCSDIEPWMEMFIKVWGAESVMNTFRETKIYDQKSFIVMEWESIEVKHTNGNAADMTICGQLVDAT